MSDHEHTWRPTPLYCGRYWCACGEQAYRSRRGLRIARRRVTESEVTARTRTTGHGGEVPALPRLDQIEKWTR